MDTGTVIAQGAIMAAGLINVAMLLYCKYLAERTDDQLEEMGILSRYALAARIKKLRNRGMGLFALAAIVYQLAHPVGFLTIHWDRIGI